MELLWLRLTDHLFLLGANSLVYSLVDLDLLAPRYVVTRSKSALHRRHGIGSRLRLMQCIDDIHTQSIPCRELGTPYDAVCSKATRCTNHET